MPHTVVFLDDILITGDSEESHLSTLEEVLQRVSNVGFRLQKKKCIFLAPEVEYLGHKIDAKGIHPLSHKVEAIHAASTPNDVTQLKSYLGHIT
jgi:hypothetical protein